MAIVVKCTACGRRFRGKNSDAGKTTHCPQCRASVVVNGQRVKDYDVFISYAPEQADVARTTCEALEAKGMRCWLVSRDVAAGVDVFAATQEAMDDSRVVVKIAIAGAATPRAVAKEVERALAAGTPVVPLQIKPAAAGGAGESLLVAAEHRAGRGSALEQSLKDLVREVKALLRMREESVHVRKEPISGKAGDGAKSQKPGSAGLRRTATIMAVMIVVAGVLVSINALSESPKVAPGPLAEAVPSTTSQPAEIEQPVMTRRRKDSGGCGV
jgi:DNA-directed RNA polymerase subunit RPC12/RpoP